MHNKVKVISSRQKWLEAVESNIRGEFEQISRNEMSRSVFYFTYPNNLMRVVYSQEGGDKLEVRQ